MANITALEAKTRFGELLERVSRGEEIIITRHDKPVARMIPEGRRSLKQVREAVAGLRALQSKIRKRTRGKILPYSEVKSAIEEGRE